LNVRAIGQLRIFLTGCIIRPSMPPGLLATLTACLATAFEGTGLLGGFGAGAGCGNRLIGRDGGDDFDDPNFGILRS
jgi:hypothetical protein